MITLKKYILLVFLLSAFNTYAQYTGTASVTQGPGDTTVLNFYTCAGGRPTNLGSIVASDSTVWQVPAQVEYFNNTFPFSSNLYNSCSGATYANTGLALAALNGSDIVVVDSAGELFTAFVFADNYFEMYVNGVPVGKDVVPYTQFNSSIVRFRAQRPFTIAMALIDWEEHLGLGYETNNTFSYYVGDGGMVMMLKDSLNNVVDITDNNWKAQTYYIAPITDLTCPYEIGNERLSDSCSTSSTNNGSGAYGLHWVRPTGWMNPGFDDSSWPTAIIYDNAAVGVNNKPAYTNFTDVFDDPAHDAQFIWSSNLLLDNEVLVRHTVPAPSPSGQLEIENPLPLLYPNPANGDVNISFSSPPKGFKELAVISTEGKVIYSSTVLNKIIPGITFPSGIYTVRITTSNGVSTSKLVIE